MIEIETALAMIAQVVKPLDPVTMPFDQALGLVLAEDVFAREAMPPFRAASVDGFAVIAADGAGWRNITGEQMAGYVAEVTVTSGHAARVTTGAPIPPGADCMIMVEETQEAEGRVNILTPQPQVGSNIRPIGQDIEAGQLVLARGKLLGPAELGLLATVGQTQVQVYRRPVVAVMSTGDEIVAPDNALKPGQIRDANRYTMMSLVRQAGAEPLDMGIIRDQQDGVERNIEQALAQADVLLTSGGVSMGQLDLVKPYLASRGTVHFGRVNTKPGKPVTFATVTPLASPLNQGGMRGVPCFAMPGFPVSAMVCFELFVRPALLQMMGHEQIYRPRQAVILGHSFRHDAARTEFHRVILRRRADGQLEAASTGAQGSGRLLSLSAANGLVILPHGHGDYEAGAVVEAMLLEIV